jgi:hypothetical protein
MFVSKDFIDMLRRNNLNTAFEWWKIYAWDVNIANNKSDDFLTKWLRLYSSTGELITSQQNEILTLNGLPVWDYQLVIDYYFFVPEWYRNFIHKLEEKYGIEITNREEGILVVSPVNHYDWTPERMWREKWMVYYPWNMIVTSVEWDVEDVNYFYSDFSQGLNYTLRTVKTEDQKQAVINFRINP